MLDTSTTTAYAALAETVRSLRFEGLPQAEAELIAAAADARLFEEGDVEERTLAAYAALRRLEACAWLDLGEVRRLRNLLMAVRSQRRAERLAAETERRLA